MPLNRPDPDALAIMVRTSTSTHVFMVKPGDTIEVSQPAPNSMIAYPMASFIVDADGVSMHSYAAPPEE